MSPPGEGTSSSNSNPDREAEYTVDDLKDRIHYHGSRLALFAREFAQMRFRRRTTAVDRPLTRWVIHPDTRWYRLWRYFILVWAVYSSFFTPLEFGFFHGLPSNLFWLDGAGQIAFLVDIVIHFFLAYRDDRTFFPIALAFGLIPIHVWCLYECRYMKSGFIFELFGCLPWDFIYKACGHREEVRYLLWIRLSRVWKVTDFFHKMEKDIRVNYLFTRIVKLIVVELYCGHTAACIFYYLATTLPASMEGYTWIGSLKLGDYSYSHFRDIDLSKRYFTSLYFAIVTMATVGYGDIHAVNTREMIFIMVYVSFDMILGAYLIGNMTALIVKGSRTERFRDKMKDLMKYMNRNRLDRDIREQIKGHVRLQYESNYTESSVLEDIPVSIRAKISESLYRAYIENVPLFRGCSSEFIHQIVIKLQEEFFLPGEVVIEQGNAVDQLYFICHGILEAVGIGEDGMEETVIMLEPNNSFGDIAILCNIPQPYTVRVCELCRLLRIDKQLFSNILQIYFVDGRKVLNNLLEGNESNLRVKQLESDITFHVGKQEAELALRVNSAAFNGDLYHLKGLIRAGADPSKTDYDGHTPLHLAASGGYEDATLFLIQEGMDVNATDKFGTTPLLEAIKNGHDKVASLLFNNGANLSLTDAGSRLCTSVAKGDTDFLKRVLSYGIDPNSRDYDHRTPLHIAAAEGLYLIAKMLLENGASVFTKDRRGSTPLDEARKSGSRPLIRLMEEAKSEELSKFPEEQDQEMQDKMHARKCTVFPFHPWRPEEKRREGVILWVPSTMEELIRSAQESLKCTGAFILSEDGGMILDTDMISANQKVHFVP